MSASGSSYFRHPIDPYLIVWHFVPRLWSPNRHFVLWGRGMRWDWWRWVCLAAHGGEACLCTVYHGLRGSASPVLTATGFVNGRWHFRALQNKHPLTDHKKIWYRWLRRRPLRLHQIWCKSVDGGLLGKWVKYNEFFSIYTFFSWTHLQVRRDDGFLRLMAQTTRTRARMCLLGVSLTLLSILGVKSQKPQFLGRE